MAEKISGIIYAATNGKQVNADMQITANSPCLKFMVLPKKSRQNLNRTQARIKHCQKNVNQIVVHRLVTLMNIP